MTEERDMTLDAPTPAKNGETASATAPAAPERKPRVCPNCSEAFFRPLKGPGGHKRFCSDKCRQDWGAREKAHGAVVITKAKIWRKNRGSGEIGKLAFQRFVEALDVLIAEDEEAGRPKLTANGPVDAYLKDVVEDRYLDRKRG
jgi:hypothetical protein